MILTDESLHGIVVREIRKAGFDVIEVRENHLATPDRGVLELSKELGAILVTEDSDFGEWVLGIMIRMQK